MTKHRFTTDAHTNLKVRQASLEAIGLWWAAGNWCSHHLTDGKIEKYLMPGVFSPVGYSISKKKLFLIISELISLKLFEDCGDYFQIHDYLEYNFSKEEVLKFKSQNSKRQRKWRENTSHVDALRNASHNASKDASHNTLVDGLVTPPKLNLKLKEIKEKEIIKEKESSSLALRKLIVSEFVKREQERKPGQVVVAPRAPQRVAQCAKWCIDMGEKLSIDSRAILERILDNYFKSSSYWEKSPFHGFLNAYMNMWSPSSGPSVPQKAQRPALPTQDDFKRLAQEG